MVCLDAPMGDRFLLEQLGDGFVLLCSEPGLACAGARTLTVPAEARLLRERYDLSGSAAYLIRPDQYVAARWKAATAGHVQSALGRAKGGAA
jgi:3-(3-hydroxy-phenyl)propionate hydroxylase